MNPTEEHSTYTDIVLAIASEDEKISHLNRSYAHLREELTAIDREVMHSYKKKWLLERRLLTIQKCKPQGPRQHKSSSKMEMPSIKSLQPEQVEELLNFLTDLKKG